MSKELNVSASYYSEAISSNIAKATEMIAKLEGEIKEHNKAIVQRCVYTDNILAALEKALSKQQVKLGEFTQYQSFGKRGEFIVACDRIEKTAKKLETAKHNHNQESQNYELSFAEDFSNVKVTGQYRSAIKFAIKRGKLPLAALVGLDQKDEVFSIGEVSFIFLERKNDNGKKVGYEVEIQE